MDVVSQSKLISTVRPQLPIAVGAPVAAEGIAVEGTGAGKGFAVLMGKQIFGAAKSEKDVLEEQKKNADEGASGLVSAALILPILKQIRRSPFGENSVFSGGIGEKTFGPAFDMQLADRISNSPQLGIKKALAERMMKRGTPATAVTKSGIDVHG